MTVATLAIPERTVVRIPSVARTALFLFTWVLAFHMIGMAVLFGAFRWPEHTVRTIAAWKEIAIIVLLVWAIVRAATGRGPRSSIVAPDVAITAMLAVAVVYALTENFWFRANIPPGAELYGFRDSVLYMLLYFVGRGSPELAEDPGTIRRIFHLAVFVSFVAILERLFVTPEMLVLFGVAAYFNEFLGQPAFTTGNVFDLPTNYWSLIGGVQVRRAGSLFLSSQGFAIPFVLLVPFASAWALGRTPRASAWSRLGYAVLWAGLLLSITRVTIVVAFIQLLLFFVLLRKPEWAVGSVAAGLAVFAVAVALLPGLLGFVWDTLTWQTGSSQTHLTDWRKGILAFGEQPWGHGLGTTDQVAVRFGLPPLTADNMFFKYAAELGIAGFAAHVAVLGTILFAGWQLFRMGLTDNQRRFGLALALATLGVILNAATAVVFNSLILSYLFFLLAGAGVSVWQRVRAQAGG